MIQTTDKISNGVKNGYTLIEVLAAVGIFTIIIAAPTGFFVGSLKGQLKTLASQKLLDNTSYCLEYISRSLRMAKKELSTDPSTACLLEGGTTLYGYNYQITRGGNGLKFINYKDECQEFFLDESDHRLKESKNGAAPIDLTAEDLEITSLKFKLSGQSQTDNDQPRVALFLKIKGAKGQKPELQPEIKIQTTISQRNLDVPY